MSNLSNQQHLQRAPGAMAAPSALFVQDNRNSSAWKIADELRRRETSLPYRERIGTRSIEIVDDSMPRSAPCGSLVLIDENDTRIESGYIYAIEYQGNQMIATLNKGPDGCVWIVFENSDKSLYPNIAVPPEQLRLLHVVGAALESRTMLISPQRYIGS